MQLKVLDSVTVSFTLPGLPAPALEPELPAAETDGKVSVEDTVAVNATLHNATYYQPWVEEVFRESYAMAYPVLPDGSTLPPLPEQNFTFNITNDAYDALEIAVRYTLDGPAPAHAANITVSVLAPDGNLVAYYKAEDPQAVAGITTDTDDSSPQLVIGFQERPLAGTYTVQISGIGVPFLELWATAYDGLAPSFQYEHLDGSLHDLREHRGNLTLIQFLGASCQECIHELGPLREVVESYSGLVQALTVDWLGDTPEQVEALLNDNDIPWDGFLDSNATAQAAYGPSSAGAYIVVDERGLLLYESNTLDPDELHGLFDQVLGSSDAV